MATTPTLNRNASTTPPAEPSPDRRTIWMVIVSLIAVVAVALTVGYATGLIGADDTTPDDAAIQPPADDAAIQPPADDDAVQPPADDDVPADDPTAQPPATVRYDEEPRANWDVTGVTANDVLNVRDAPGVDAAILATLAHDAAEFESTGRIAHVGDQLWREVIVPGDGVGWVNAAFLTETAPPATVRYDEEPRANWDVTGVTANDVLNVRDAPGVDAAIVATLAHDAAEFESTGRIAHVGDQLWREVIVPGDGVGWVSAAYLTETK